MERAEAAATMSIDSSLLRRAHALAPARSGVLIDAAAYYRALADALDHAERFVLITGWQIDTRVPLRRDPGEPCEAHSLAAVLKRACQRSPGLQIRILPWDFNPVYLIDREWASAERFEAIAPGQIECVWDSHHAPSASQHEKMVIIDGDLAFVGGIDLCDHRWDDRRHLPVDPRRCDLDGQPCGPYHDVMAVVRGPIVADLTASFRDRWALAADTRLDGLEPSPSPHAWPTFPNEHVIPTRQVAIVRTRGLGPEGEDIPEAGIQELLVPALHAAERLVYVETQYFTSRVLVDALASRFLDPNKPRMEVVFLLPARTEGVLEQAAVQGPQRAALLYLTQLAARQGHAVGAFCPAVMPTNLSTEDPEAPPMTYVHSKLVIVDDQFLCLGSANLTNRSMGVDSEMNLAWVADGEEQERAIGALRTKLLSEHVGLSDDDGADVFGADGALLPVLVRLAARPDARLVAHSFADHRADDHTSPLEDLLAEIGDPQRIETFYTRARTVGQRLAAFFGDAA